MPPVRAAEKGERPSPGQEGGAVAPPLIYRKQEITEVDPQCSHLT
jgi:hypothetical protein